jgi:hypothetical protein
MRSDAAHPRAVLEATSQIPERGLQATSILARGKTLCPSLISTGPALKRRKPCSIRRPPNPSFATTIDGNVLPGGMPWEGCHVVVELKQLRFLPEISVLLSPAPDPVYSRPGFRFFHFELPAKVLKLLLFLGIMIPSFIATK